MMGQAGPQGAVIDPATMAFDISRRGGHINVPGKNFFFASRGIGDIRAGFTIGGGTGRA